MVPGSWENLDGEELRRGRRAPNNQATPPPFDLHTRELPEAKLQVSPATSKWRKVPPCVEAEGGCSAPAPSGHLHQPTCAARPLLLQQHHYLILAGEGCAAFCRFTLS
uniref:Uncharacterized protein n=1 Tax=Naja naja TaxID=35670 RepID=A0A8C6XD14_NAJNA